MDLALHSGFSNVLEVANLVSINGIFIVQCSAFHIGVGVVAGW